MRASENITLSSEHQTPHLTAQEIACVRRIRERARHRPSGRRRRRIYPWVLGLAVAGLAVSLTGLVLSLL